MDKRTIPDSVYPYFFSKRPQLWATTCTKNTKVASLDYYFIGFDADKIIN